MYRLKYFLLIFHCIVESKNTQDEAVDLACTKWEYDNSEMETLVTQNNWVCGKASVVGDLYNFGGVGVVLGVFVFRCALVKSNRSNFVQFGRRHNCV